jgi:zinc transport system ATP-binding protein
VTLAFRLEGIRVGYDGIPVLQDADLALPEGGVLGMIGPNGAGKSTLLRVLLGTLEPAAGSVEVLGTTAVKARPRVGYVPQTHAVERGLPATVTELVLTGFVGLLPLWRNPGRPERERADEWCARLRIDHLRHRSLRELSGGQLQLALVARALVRDPALLLLDEPTANADARAEANLFQQLEEVCRDRTAVLVSHDVGVLSRHVRSIACVGGGRIVHHEGNELPADALEEIYGCPVDLIAHGHPHRVLADHGHDGCGHDHGAPP